MKTTRRDFFRTVGAGVAGSVLATGASASQGAAPGDDQLAGTTRTRTICPFCAVGCGLLVASRDGKVVKVWGDPEHPINRGSTCSKAAALPQIIESDRRLGRVLYRAPGSASWETLSWERAMTEIARRIKKTRDATFVAASGDVPVNRTEGIACLGGAALDNEECYLYSKLARAMGVTFLEHQARI